MDKVQHFEIPADDTDRAKKFYSGTFGWKMSDWPMADGSVYIGIHTGPVDEKNMTKESGFINGGMFKRGGTSFPITAPVITPVVQDIDETLEKVKAGGGSVALGKTEIPGMGWYAYIKDTEGNTIGVFQEAKKA